MYRNSLVLACLCSLMYIASCTSRLPPDESHKPDLNPPTGDLEPAPEQMDTSLLAGANDEDLEKRAWHKLSNVWGKRDWNKLNNMGGKRDWNKLNNMWGKRDWNKLNGMWGKRDEGSDLPPYWGKRGWNNLSNVWGKRGWNNLNNMWGKRGWNNLSNVWGKRTSSQDDGSKRTQWNNLKSVWGKRDVDSDLPAIWEQIPVEEEIACITLIEDSFQGIFVPDQM